MSTELLPHQIDNTYRGRTIALWMLALILLVRVTQSMFVVFDGHSIVVSAAGIPLETYTPAGAQTVVAAFALLGVYRLTISLVCVVVLLRYRSVITLMFVLLAFEYLAGELVNQFVPLVRSGTPPAPVVNFVLFVLTIVGGVLSFRRSVHVPLDASVGTSR